MQTANTAPGISTARLMNPASSVARDIDGPDRALHCVSVIVPCRNERDHIENFCRNVLQQALPDGWRLQLLVADGLSDDGTREILRQLSEVDPRIQWIDNPQRFVSSGLNAALSAAEGEVIVRMDVHTDYAPDYIGQALAVLAESGADNVGGPWHAQPVQQAEPMQHAIAAAFQCRWVAGGALSRQLDYNGRADTVYLGCWPRSTFERFGMFDETLVRNQDDEHNLRITTGGGLIWQSSRLRSLYRPRAHLGPVFRQYLQYGYWKPFVMKKHGQTAAWRHGAPALLVLGMALGLAMALGGVAAPLGILTTLYASAVLLMTLRVAQQNTCSPGALWRVPLVIMAYHGAYGVGSLMGAWDVWRHGSGRSWFATLTR